MLTIVLRDSLHQPQYVEKLEKILRFMIKEKALTSEDLDKLWEAQVLYHPSLLLCLLMKLLLDVQTHSQIFALCSQENTMPL